MSFLSDAGRGLIRWTPKILEASADDIARFGPNAARVRALLNFIPTMSDDAAKISDQAVDFLPGRYVAMDSAWNEAKDSAWNAAKDDAWNEAWYRAMFETTNKASNDARSMAKDSARFAAENAGFGEALSDLIKPDMYRTLTNPMASARALDRLAGRAPESFVPIARDLGERGLVAAPSDIVSAFRISKLPPHVQPLVTGLVDSGLTLEEAIAAARALS